MIYIHNNAPTEKLFHDIGRVCLEDNLSDMLKRNVDVNLNIRLIPCELVSLMCA